MRFTTCKSVQQGGFGNGESKEKACVVLEASIVLLAVLKRAGMKKGKSNEEGERNI
ncbi:hypothetical protein ACRPOS_007300 [Bartonella heixiaziensis]|uniref:hypothetical protein n=1 Tax=Bartonella heixiaziensis TaxID=1461000 RepID=UPI0039089F58